MLIKPKVSVSVSKFMEREVCEFHSPTCKEKIIEEIRRGRESARERQIESEREREIERERDREREREREL